LWRDALKIIKLCVMRSSTFSAPPPNIFSRHSSASAATDTVPPAAAAASIATAVELPGLLPN